MCNKRINIMFWIILLLSVAIRLYAIDAPVLDHHSIRQVDTASITRNFYENGMKILYPQYDGGGATNYVETEFQLYTYIVAILYKVFGVHEFIGRIVSIVMFYLTAFVLYKLVREIYNNDVARYSIAVLSLLPLSVSVSRSFQPESMMLFFTVASVYYCFRWTKYEEVSSQLLSCIFLTLSVLTKLPSLYIGLPILYLIISRRGIRQILDVRIILLLAGSATVIIAWYYHSHNLFLQSGNTFIGGGNKFSDLALLTDVKFYTQIFINRFAGMDFTPVGYLLLFSGLFIPRLHDDEKLFDYWLVAVLVYIFIAGKGNLFHDYYQYPILPVGAVFIGKAIWRFVQDADLPLQARQYGLLYQHAAPVFMMVLLYPITVLTNAAEKSVKLTGKISFGTAMLPIACAVVFLLLVAVVCWVVRKYYPIAKLIQVFTFILMVFGAIFYLHINNVYDIDERMLTLGHRLAENTAERDLIAVSTDSSNGQLYYAHRKGWSFFRKLPPVSHLQYLRENGASVFVTDRLQELRDNKDMNIYLSAFDNRDIGGGYRMFFLSDGNTK